MGVSSSKMDDDKALLLCHERKRYVKQALDGRCSLASAHAAYIQALRNTGTALGKLVGSEAPIESSLYTSTSTSGTTEPLVLIDKSASQFSNSSPSPSPHVDTTETFSPTPSPMSSDRLHVNYMKSGRNYSTTIEERPPIPLMATLKKSSVTFSNPSTHVDESSNFDASRPFSVTPPWDYFGLFHPIDNHFSLQDGTVNQVSDNVDYIRRLREEEGIPELEEDGGKALILEEEGEKSSANGKSEYAESEDEFDQPSSESLVRIFKNRNDLLDVHSTNGSTGFPSLHMAPEAEQNLEKATYRNNMDRSDETPNMIPKSTPHVAPFPANENFGSEKDFVSENKLDNKDFISDIKEIENLFFKASDSGKEIPRMLEANTVNFRPLLSQRLVRRSMGRVFYPTFMSCCRDATYTNEEPASSEVKYLTWQRSVSYLSSSTPVPLGPSSGDDVVDMRSNLFSSVCMNSGSHASTLDRLYAWERKLYDEVKVSGIVRREYDMKCKLLRDLNSKARRLDFRGDSLKIDSTRAKVKDLHSRIRVAIHRVDSISKKIEELRDKELQPQLEELIDGLSRMWETMVQCHRRQHSIISTLNSNGGPKISIQSDSSFQAAIILESELNSLYSSFTKWISTHKSYLQSINQWLLKCVFPIKQQKYVRRRNATEFSPESLIAPPIYVTCRDWLAGIDTLPTKEVAVAIRELAAETSQFKPHQEKNHATSRLSFSLSRKIERSGELTNSLPRNGTSVERSLDLDNLQLHLEVFLEWLKTFSESSVMIYDNLATAITKANNSYKSGRRL